MKEKYAAMRPKALRRLDTDEVVEAGDIVRDNRRPDRPLSVVEVSPRKRTSVLVRDEDGRDHVVHVGSLGLSYTH